ncbi:MAG TPA: glycine--tRNA ligase [Candidatus Paceibacterota bacterium]|nr:glycine--tRNA ligase [Candidatus Paceibacterota bacterium]HOV88634.1 glycine--tRNA ligase [Candidatus Paceibacterota bacterium]HRU33476.1 glycine--tRNA ligase [Candidatus Paceibacterota bacterium]
MNEENRDLMDKIISLAKRRGFIFPSSEIYGGFSSSYDYGPLGVELKNNIKRLWWKEMLNYHDNIVGLDSAILMSPKVWQASGHLSAGFADSLVECSKCHHRFREDVVQNNRCPDCGGELMSPRKFNLMMKTFVGPVEDEASITYLRAETCQGIYLNYENVLNSMRLKIPFGIAQIGKSFRNEINPGNFTYRTREFEQMEMQFFVRPEEAEKWFQYWVEQRLNWYINLGIKEENLRIHQQTKDELAHYALAAYDIEYKFPFGWKEIEGIHNRGDWDLSNHSKYSGHELVYFDEKTKEKFTPYIIETSAGADRGALVFLIDAYEEVKGGRTQTTEAKKEVEIVLKFHPLVAPIKVAVFPLLKNKEELVNLAKEIYQNLKKHFMAQYDEIDSIGRRYRRQDEIGTPYCVTVDFQSVEDKTVTVRDRDSLKQERVPIDNLTSYLKERVNFE